MTSSNHLDLDLLDSPAMGKAKAVRKQQKSKLDMNSKLRATSKAVKGKLLFENRALACHGKRRA